NKPRARKASVPVVHLNCCVQECGLDKNTIKRYVKQQMSKIKYCYEKELLASPELRGTVATSFTIDRNGTVTQASSKGVNDAVAECVEGVFRSIYFPKPKDGGVCTVNDYQVDFAPTGE